MKPFENIVGKEENAGNQHFLLFPQCCQSFPKQQLNFSVTFIWLSAKCFEFRPVDFDVCNGLAIKSLLSTCTSLPDLN